MGELYDINGLQMHVETHGDGEPLLFLHGGLGAGDNWQYIFSAPPSGFRLIAPDQRGHGASTKTAVGECTWCTPTSCVAPNAAGMRRRFSRTSS